MISFSKATPRPWQRSAARSRTQAGWPFISIGSEGSPGVVLVLYGRTNDEQIAAEQDAALICEAVNRHDDLVGALKWALPLAEVALEDARQRRLQAGHTDIGAGTERLGLWPDEQARNAAARAALYIV